MLTSTVPSLAGEPPAYAAPAASDTAQIGTTLIVRNDSASSITVTFVTPGNLTTGDSYPDKVYTVAAAAEAWIPVLDDYRNPDTGVADVMFSATASVTAAAISHR